MMAYFLMTVFTKETDCREYNNNHACVQTKNFSSCNFCEEALYWDIIYHGKIISANFELSKSGG